MAELEKTIKAEIEGLIEQAMNSFNPGDIENTIDILKEAWEKLPKPKEMWGNSFLIAKYITHVYFNAGNYQKALEWAEIFLKTDPGRDYGESEFMLAKVHFQLNNKETARKYFVIANEKSDERVWKGEKDIQYYKFFKSFDD